MNHGVTRTRNSGSGRNRFGLLGIATTAGIALAAFVAPAQATTLSSFDLFSGGDGLLTRDSATLLEWVDLTATAGRSKLDIIAAGDNVDGMGNDWLDVDLGFRIATNAEIEQLWTNHGFPVIGAFDATNNPFYATFVALLGETNPAGVGDSLTSTKGYSLESPGPGGTNSPEVVMDLQSDGSGTLVRTNAFSSESFADPLIGTWLVRAFTVPEPVTLGSFGLGLAALGLAARGRRRRA